MIVMAYFGYLTNWNTKGFSGYDCILDYHNLGNFVVGIFL